MKDTSTTRRTFLKGAAALGLIPVLNIETARAAEKVPVDDPAASALNYVKDATKANRVERMGTPGDQQFCDNCQHYSADAGPDGWGGCALFQNRLVAAKGWCSGWMPVSGS